jgi:5-methylcytosine-specific restriction protein A
MSLEFNIGELERRLETRFGIAIGNEQVTFDGGTFEAIRPLDIEVGNGFTIAIALTPKQVEASLHLDHFAGGLLRRMSDADSETWNTFTTLVGHARERGAHVYVAINGKLLEPSQVQFEAWRKLELDVTIRLKQANSSSAGLIDEVIDAVSCCLSLALALLPIEEFEDVGERGLPEGAKSIVEVNRYERSPANRAACIAHFGPVCQVCMFSFEATYGELGEGFIEVHHLVPVSKLGPDYFVDPIRDLITVCGNCHSMLHKRDPPLAPVELRNLIRRDRSMPSSF